MYSRLLNVSNNTLLQSTDSFGGVNITGHEMMLLTFYGSVINKGSLKLSHKAKLHLILSLC